MLLKISSAHLLSPYLLWNTLSVSFIGFSKGDIYLRVSLGENSILRQLPINEDPQGMGLDYFYI